MAYNMVLIIITLKFAHNPTAIKGNNQQLLNSVSTSWVDPLK